MAYYKKNQAVDEQNYVPGGYADWGGGSDPIRGDYVANWYPADPDWTIHEAGTLHFGPSLRGISRNTRYSVSGPGAPRISIRFNNVADELTYDYEPTLESAAPLPGALPFGKFTQQLVIAGDPNEWPSQQAWVTYVESAYVAGNSYVDHAQRYWSPFATREASALGTLSPDTATAHVKFDYNYYIRSYENQVAGSSPTGTILPHLYTFYLDKDRLTYDAPRLSDAYERIEEYQEYKEFITLGGHILDMWLPVYNISARRLDGTYDASDYYSSWASTYPEAATDPVVQSLERRYQNIIVPTTTMPNIEEYNTYAELFPMFTEINFTLPIVSETARSGDRAEGGDYITYLNEYEHAEYLFNNMIRSVLVDKDVSRSFTRTRGYQESHLVVSSAGAEPSLTSLSVNQGHSTFDFGSWMLNSMAATSLYDASFYATFGDSATPVVLDNIADDLEDADAHNWFLLSDFDEDEVAGYPSSTDGFATAGLSTLMLFDFRNYLHSTMNRPATVGGKARTYEEILNGIMAYSEDIFFKVSKYEVTPGGARSAEPVQSYFLPNTAPVRQQIKLIDTQMKYNQAYEYDIRTYRLVVGTETTYTKVEVLTSVPDGITSPPVVFGDTTSDPSGYRPHGEWEVLSSIYPPPPMVAVDGPPPPDRPGYREIDHIGTAYVHHPGFEDSVRYARVEVQVRPNLRLVELPYVSAAFSSGDFGRGIMLDDPPLPPDIATFPYKGVNDKILFTLNTGVGSRRRRPFSLPSDADAGAYITNLLNMNEDRLDNTILYENDDPSEAFEIRRITTWPTSYDDFEQGVVYVAKSETENTAFRRASSTSFLDIVVPNTKYYYMFRAYDAHDHLSYPSSIYEVELVDDDGAVYPRVRTVPLRDDDGRKRLTKRLRRFLQIRPQFSQVIVDRGALPMPTRMGESAPISDTLPMGVDAESIWGKRFKIRLTSRKTGKKIDLNVSFDKEYDDTPPIDSDE